MIIQDHLKQFLDEAPDINLAAFGDLSSGLILNWASTAPCPREVLDLLGEHAGKCLGLLDKPALLPHLDSSVAGASMVRFTEQESQIFTRLSPGSDDFLCTVCEPGAELAPLLHLSSELARWVAGAA
jgi:hypothetical protein